MTTDEAYKTCPLCGREKPLSDFGRQTRNRDGRDTYCLQCRRKKYREAHGGLPRLLAKISTEELQAEIDRRTTENSDISPY